MLFAAQQRLAESGIHDICFILAPHEIHDSRMAAWEQKMPGNIARYSQLSAAPANAKTLFIDNIGMLSRLYAYATVAYVGGGFGSGLHNILEAAVFGCPVLYGNRIRKFPEAAALSAAGGGMILSDANALAESLTRLLSDEPLRQQMATAAETFVRQQVGATEQIMAWVRANG
jgi:3-deoxy-D-manno-octulosonic-acid transferase